MEISNETKVLSDFVEEWGSNDLYSTGATVVNFSGSLYNVDGSSPDPKIDGTTWKQLLIDKGINDDCYVTNAVPPSTSTHPSFSVGGHMTINSDGSVATGGTCYLMPLCSWHNNKARDGIAFSHTETEMLELSGYMQAELGVTFMARLPSDDMYAIIYPSDGRWGTENLPATWRADEKSLQLQNLATAGLPQHFVLFKRKKRDGQVIHVIEDARLPH